MCVLYIAQGLQRDSEKLAERLVILNEAHKDMKNDVAVAKRAMQKTTSDVAEVQDRMKQQVRSGSAT